MRSYASIQGWFDFQDLYEDQVQRARSESVFVEIGCWLGRSLAYLGQKVQESGKTIHTYGVEHGLGSSEHREFVLNCGGTIIGELSRNLLECGVFPTVTIIVAPSICAARLFPLGSVDFAFIDAGHDYQSVLADLTAWWPRIKPGGTLAGHDYGDPSWSEVTQAVNDFFGRCDLNSLHSPRCWEIIKPVVAGVWPERCRR
jgi:hypothetical protein